MTYEEKYKNALERAKVLIDKLESTHIKGFIYHIFPELKESEDERTRKAIKKALQVRCDGSRIISDEPVTLEEAIAWLENQYEQKTKPKFSVGDWITDGRLTCKVLGVTGKSYELHLHNDDYCHFETDMQSVDKYYHLWTIADAKDGDVLCYEIKNDFKIFIYKQGHIHYHCCYSNEHLTPVESFFTLQKHQICYIHPATKEQCELLFQQIKEAGYEWDNEKKVLKKIEPKKLDADRVIAWLVANILDYEYFVKLFKKDFGL